MEKIPEEKRRNSDYMPSSGEYFLEQMTHDPAAIWDILQKIETGAYEVVFIKNEKGEILEEKVINKESGKIVFYSDVSKTGKAVIAPHIKNRGN